ncbi:SWI/SNF family DNA-dependent ATPase Ris1 [Pochonia chlamydosporia 170]|uniref:SWI/SNF family DNA-dependent ATPase Ris1 n=1 Tax=Pochonia chlamydosporia 170 TaxID=1380566 RepID=A0A179F766_METCM|nr:SWI/SNF family DNA-dependent ATPase Ris1 [Pochonia chlamydosporia 170]OAQ60939.2 SWI/SNF family DNA-dependent ATPase Ris1 [Pochonia chlamydosporia 170]
MDYREYYFYHRPTWDIEAQARGEVEEKFEEPVIDLVVPERARLAEILCFQPKDLTEEQISCARIEAVDLMVALCDKRDAGRAGQARSRPPRLPRVQQFIKEESPAFAAWCEPDLFPLLMDASQCPDCIGDERLIAAERTFEWCRPTIRNDHFDDQHLTDREAIAQRGEALVWVEMAELSVMEDGIEKVMDELTVQQVMLSSMEGLAWDGVEAERNDIIQEIERLKHLLKKLKKDRARDENGDDIGGSASQNQSPPGTPTSQAPPPQPKTPVVTGGRSSKMDPYSGYHDVWDSPSSISLPSRKRDLRASDPFTMNSQNKSRRTTPNPAGDRASTPSRLGRESDGIEFIDIIDLTGDDVDFDSSVVAEQIRQQQRHEQENRDMPMAMQFSSQYSPVPSSSSNANASEPYAFVRLMATQRANSRGRTSWDWQSLPSSSTQTPVPSGETMRASMPGSWDNPSPWDRRPLISHAPLPSNAVKAVSRHSIGATGQRPSGYGTQSGNPRHVSRNSQFSSPALRNVFQPTPSPRPPFFGVPWHPGDNGSTISNAIERTSMIDHANVQDAFGNPLHGRLARVLDDDYESPVTGKELDDLLKNIRPDIDIPEHNRGVGPPGLKYPLYRHQEVALTWMKQMEEGTNKGGILADDMGLGKTISTLGLMLANLATSRPKTNLIIGPLSLMRQWEEEISKKTKLAHRLSVFVYHGKKASTDDLLKYDVVITTYGTLAQELRRREKFIEENKDRKINFNDKSCAVKFPLLHPEKAIFHRIILDEAQCIKNRSTQTAKACHSLRATYRWCLTGTPMMNGILELYSLLKFLRIKPYNAWENFRQTFGVLFGQKGDPKSIAMSKLRALLKAIMMRRKKDSKLEGKPILQLPEKREHIVYAKLSTDERDFYKQLEQHAHVLFSKYLREGSVGRNYSNILVLLLRLRQACCHPHLNLDVDDAVSPITDADVEKFVKELDVSIVQRIKSVEAFECPICYDAVRSPSFFVPCGHDSCKDCLSRIVDTAISQNLHEGNESDRAKCPVCRGVFEPRKCFTYELFKKVHMPETAEKVGKIEPVDDESSDEEEDSSEEDDATDEVNSKGTLKGFVVDDDDEEELADIDVLKKEASALESKERKKSKMAQRKEKGKIKAKMPEVKPSMLKSLRVEAAKNRQAYKRYMRYLRTTWMPAAKVTECMNLLKEIQETGEKTIAFSQWTLLLDLLEVAMWHDKFPHKPLRYDGGMSGDQRATAACNFRDIPDNKVMLVSLRAGNAGLNLTVATRVIIMDPFWNPYIEMQAIDRTYRIGQQKEVEVYRILTQETVEDRIVALQNKKKEIVEAALDEAESMKIGRLGESELKFLFNSHG